MGKNIQFREFDQNADVEIWVKRINDLMTDRKVTQQELAKACDISPSVISDYVGIRKKDSRLRTPKVDKLQKIAKYFGVSVDYLLGENDLSLAMRLCKAGSDHRKFIRQILVSVDITAPMYWWKEFDTYKVGTVANSTSTMHKIHSKPFELADFSVDHLTPDSLEAFTQFVNFMETKRISFVETKNKEDWYDLIQLLPSSYNQTRTVTMNYENLLNMYFARRNHKLEEWHTYCDWILTLPYTKELFLQLDK